MAKSTPDVVVLRGSGVYKEATAGGAILPGHILYRSSATAVVVHATADGPVRPLFAIENGQVGDGIDTAYASADTVPMIYASRGTEIYALLAAAAPAIVVNDPLGSAGDGTLKKITVGAGTLAGAVVGFALEAVDNSGGGSVARIRVEVL